MSSPSWGQKIQEIASSQSSSDELLEELVSVSDTEEIHQASAFWVPLFRRHCGDMHVPRRDASSPVILLSACTGSFAEASVLKDLLVNVGCGQKLCNIVDTIRGSIL